jgi:hypothetical protein
MNMVRQAPMQQQYQQQPPMGGAMSGGYNGMQGQGAGMGQPQPQYQGYGMPPAGGGMQPNRGMAPPTPQFSAPQGQYNQMGMQQQQQQQAPNMMGMGMGMGMQPQGQAPRGMMPPNVPSYGYPTQGTCSRLNLTITLINTIPPLSLIIVFLFSFYHSIRSKR